jgi:hypothetical protein
MVDTAAAIYFAGHERQDQAHGENSPYNSEQLYERVDEPFRGLSRVGGVPTRVPGRDIPEGVFLIQADLLSLATFFIPWRPFAAAVFADAGLPTEGVLQLFHTTTGDSLLDPHLAGGGARLMYLTEAELWLREPLDVDTFDYPVSETSGSLLPTFAPTPAAGSGEALDTVLAAQNEADRTAGQRGGVDVPRYWFQKAPQWSRMLGLPHHYYGLEDGHRGVLDKEIPLTDNADRHILLFNLASERQYDQVFGDEGRLEIWIRRSDLLKKKFEHVVSFLHNT